MKNRVVGKLIIRS